MGYMRHHGMVITGGDWGKGNQSMEAAHAEALRLLGHLVSPLIESQINGYKSFFIAPDGSKEGWGESDAGDDKRRQFMVWMDKQRHDDGSGPFAWAEVQYGDDNEETRVTAHSDEPFRAELVRGLSRKDI